MITQLHDVGSAGQSSKMAVKNHQKPFTLIVFKSMNASLAVCKSEINSRFPCQVIHHDHLFYMFHRLFNDIRLRIAVRITIKTGALQA